MKSSKRNRFRIPDHIANNMELIAEIDSRFQCYNFEVCKTLWYIEEKKASKVALQFPEGLIIFACDLADIIEKYSGCDVVILGDIVYGACCVDDFTSSSLGADVLIHYGHSCLVPIAETNRANVLYVFVDMKLNISNMLDAITGCFGKTEKLFLVSTIQFVSSIQSVVSSLLAIGYNVFTGQSFPLSRGEILGCTSPVFPQDADAIVYIGDGRFHIESAMIQNPKVPAYRFDPYTGVITREYYDFKRMMMKRKKHIELSRACGGTFGVILGTLGRQGSVKVMKCLQQQLKHGKKNDFVTILMSEITPDILSLFRDEIQIWVQIGCPRLSIDWGDSFSKPILTPYELSVVTGDAVWDNNQYPMDYYSKDSLGPWTPNHVV